MILYGANFCTVPNLPFASISPFADFFTSLKSFSEISNFPICGKNYAEISLKSDEIGCFRFFFEDLAIRGGER